MIPQKNTTIDTTEWPSMVQSDQLMLPEGNIIFDGRISVLDTLSFRRRLKVSLATIESSILEPEKALAEL